MISPGTEYVVPSLAQKYLRKSAKLFMKVFPVICVYVHAWETNTYARVNLFEMLTYRI